MSKPAPFPPVDNSAPCTQVDPELFFDGPGRNETKLAKAKAVCRSGCPFREPCLLYALSNKVAGVWSATDEDERAALRRQRGIKALPMSFADLVPSTPATPGHGDWSGLNQHRARNERPCASCRAFASEDARKRRARQAEVSA